MVAVSTEVPSAGAAGKIFENGYYDANAHPGASADLELNFIDPAVVDRRAFVCELGATAPTGWETNTLAIVRIPTRTRVTSSGAFFFSGTVNAH